MNDPNQEADVCLILEGTYPYILGGVSAWVHQIISGLPDLTFSLYFIGSKEADYKKQVYDLPPNVIGIHRVFLQDRISDEELEPIDLTEDESNSIYDSLLDFFRSDDTKTLIHHFWKLTDELEQSTTGFNFGNLLSDKEAWNVLCKAYEEFCPNESFIDYFWTVRFLHIPIWTVWKDRKNIPRAKVYHSVSAGYAGFSGALASRLTGRPFFLTEHGIYTKERIAEISQADWIYESFTSRIDYREGLGKLKQLWINLFKFLGNLAYAQAEKIITLYDGNALTQIEFGADGSKIEVIPNGIQPDNFNAIRIDKQKRWEVEPQKKAVGFIGRIVPIKDVKTLLRAASTVCERIPGVEFLLAGPYGEDPVYYEECCKICDLLNIKDKVHFMGMQKIMDVLPKMDVIVLTSISEGLPLVILEGMASGIPIVATDVGACRELVFGRTPEDKALGHAGRITKILSPAETAHALVQLLKSPDLVRQTAESGYQRAVKFYSMDLMLTSYRDLYSGLVAMDTKALTQSVT